MQRISSMQNPQVQAWRKLKTRQARAEAGVFLVEGEKMVSEALALPGRVTALLVDDARQDKFAPLLTPDAFLVTEAILAAVTDTKTPQGIAAFVTLPESPTSLGPRLIALDGVQDPGNVGTILRTADAAGFDGVLLTKECADVFSPKCLRATMGSIFRMPVTVCDFLPDTLLSLKGQGYAVLSSELGGSSFYDRPAPGEKYVLIIGNEGNGVSPRVSACADSRLALPMYGGAESLNAAIAAGIMMYDLVNRG